MGGEAWKTGAEVVAAADADAETVEVAGIDVVVANFTRRCAVASSLTGFVVGADGALLGCVLGVTGESGAWWARTGYGSDEAPFLRSAKRKAGSLEELWLWRCECKASDGGGLVMVGESSLSLELASGSVASAPSWPAVVKLTLAVMVSPTVAYQVPAQGPTYPVQTCSRPFILLFLLLVLARLYQYFVLCRLGQGLNSYRFETGSAWEGALDSNQKSGSD